MEIQEKGKLARAYFEAGYNCAQSVAGAFAGEMGLEPVVVFRLASSFGGGMGRLREVCGAVSGMFLAAGMLYGYADPQAYQEKAEHYSRIQELAAAFQEKNDSIICRELLGLSCEKDDPRPDRRTASYYAKRPCAQLVQQAAEILAAYLEEHPQ